MVRHDWGGVEVVRRVVAYHYAGCFGYQPPCFFDVVLLAEFDVHRLAVAAHHGHTCHRCTDHDVWVAQYLAGLVHQFLLLCGIAVGQEITPVGEEVAENLVGVGRLILVAEFLLHVLAQLRAGHLMTEEIVLLGLQLAHSLDAGAGDALVGGHYQAANTVTPMQARQGQYQLYCRAVGVGDDAGGGCDGFDVDFGHHQRHVVVHAPAGGVVDDGASHGGKLGGILAGGGGSGREYSILRMLCDGLFHTHHRQLAPGKVNFFPHRLGRGGGQHLTVGKSAFLQHLQHHAADQACGAYNSYLHGLVDYLSNVIVPVNSCVMVGSSELR